MNLFCFYFWNSRSAEPLMSKIISIKQRGRNPNQLYSVLCFCVDCVAQPPSWQHSNASGVTKYTTRFHCLMIIHYLKKEQRHHRATVEPSAKPEANLTRRLFNSFETCGMIKTSDRRTEKIYKYTQLFNFFIF